MGLLDVFNTDQGRMGLGLLAAAAPRSDGAGLGQRLAEGVGSFDAYKQNALKQKMLEAQMQQAMEQAAQQKADRARQQTIQQGMGQFFKPGQQALSPLMGDAATGIMPSAGKAAIAPSFDSAGASSFLAANGDYEQALKLMPKPKELQVNKLDVKDFTPESVQKFAQTGSYADLVRMDKAHFGDSGGQLVAMNPFTGQPLNSINKTQTPDSKASVAATMRGQNMTDARARERLSFDQGAEGYSTKPLPASALKMQNDAIDAIGTASGINQMLTSVEKQISDKKVKFGPVSNLVNQGLNAAGMSTEESRNFSSFKSNLEKIRNESLRLNSGVQTDGDAQRAWNELFQNINDTELVKQRLGEIKTLNNRAVELQKLKVDGIRGNYKASPYDYGKIPSSVGASGGWSITKE